MYRLGPLGCVRAAAQQPTRVFARNLHLESSGAAQLLSQNLPSTASIVTATDGLPFKLSASRVYHAPTLEAAGTGGKPSVLKLDVSSSDLPPTDTWFGAVGVPASQRAAARAALQGLWEAWRANGLLRVTGTLKAGDQGAQLGNIRVVADDFALKDHPGVRELGAPAHPLEDQAEAGKLFYHKGDGNIACYGYGAGIAMSTMDALCAAGGRPANFLDGGGGATEANVRAAMELILADAGADVIFVNSFGGLTKMDLIAAGAVAFINERRAAGGHIPPIVMRLRGTGEEEAREILQKAAIPEVEYIGDMKEAANRAVELSLPGAKKRGIKAAPPQPAPPASRPVLFARDGQYERTISNLKVQKDDPVLVVGLGKASQANSTVASEYGTNIVGASAPRKGGSEFLSKPVFNDVATATRALRPRIASVFAPPAAAADTIIECIAAEVPLIVSYAEGVTQHDQLRVQAALRSQGKSRLIGANCPGAIFPHQRVKLGIQPLRVHAPGIVGLISRSGTISYDLAAQTTALGLGQSAVFGLGGDPFPGTRSWEALKVLLEDPLTKIVCLVGEVGGQMEEEAAAVYADYVSALPAGTVAKPVVGFVAGAATQRGKTYGHAGAVWWDDSETAAAKRKVLANAGFVMAPTIGDIGGLIKDEVDRLELDTHQEPSPQVAFG